MRCSVYSPEFPETVAQVPHPTHGPAGANHVIKYRIAIPFLGRRYYLAFFIGRCQRSPDRVVAEGQRRSWRHVAFSCGTVFLMVSTMLMCGAATIYLAKSMLGIDLFQEHSFLHHLFFD